jgi:hypothetical protein
MKFDELKKKAESHLLEVEDLIELAASKNTDAIPFLKWAIEEQSRRTQGVRVLDSIVKN